ncbi:MAG: alpha/beta fold hydrolase, partial [Myxococcales bacterium]|nr:alpha/beta fold hydrolase [Myxococcales bacterium]
DVVSQLLDFVITEILHGEEDFDEGTPLLALGVLDSLSMVSLLTFIQERFGVVVVNDDVTVENFEDVAAIAAMVEQRVGTGAMVHEARSAMEQAVYVLQAAGVRSERQRLSDGRSMHLLTVEGSLGAPWILIPGLGNPASAWGNMLKALDGEHRAAAIDLAGFGLSEGQARPHYRDHVADLEELLALRYPDEATVLVGSSAGALMALEYARRHPQRVRALVLLGFGAVADPPAWMA